MKNHSCVHIAESASGYGEIPLVFPIADDIPIVEPVNAPATAPAAQASASLLRRVVGWIGLLWEWCFGTAVLILGLAVLAAIPILQFLSFGYLLEVSGRIGRSGRLRDGFIGYRQAARFGTVVLGAGLCILPLKFVSSLWLSAELIEPGSGTSFAWRIALAVLTILVALHIALAFACGGRLHHFLIPFLNPVWLIVRLAKGGYYTQVRDAVCDFVISLRLPYFFWLGLRGFVGGFIWLAIPVTLLAVGRTLPPAGVIGWLMLLNVLLYLPFLQVQFAVENRFRALFDIGGVRRRFRRAPWAFAFAFFITLSFALPLYLLKIEMIPREAAWLPNLVFMVFIFPARLATGWSFGRTERRATDRHWFFRWTGRLMMLVFSAIYAVVVYFTQFVAWHGIWSLYEQHAFLLPVPFFKM